MPPLKAAAALSKSKASGLLKVKDPTIPNVAAFGMFTLSVILYLGTGLVELIPLLGAFLGIFIGIFGFFSFFVWFAQYGVSYIGGKHTGLKLLGLAGMVEGAFPYLNMLLPGIIGGVAGIIIATRLDDMEKQKKPDEAPRQKVRLAGPQKIQVPANDTKIQAANDNAAAEYEEAA